jgi:hypothetical protein
LKVLAATASRLRSGDCFAHFFGHDECDVPDEALTNTLLMFVELTDPRHDPELTALLNEAEIGRYVPNDPGLPDYGINDINLWLRPPHAQAGHICISNENTDYCIDGGGGAQQFTYVQFRVALQHWREFQALLARDGKSAWVGKRFETALP